MKKSFNIVLLFVFSLTFIFCLASCNIVHDGKLLVKDEHSHWYLLDNGEKVDVEPHDFSIVGRYVAPTCTKDGVQIYKCSCDKALEVVIPALGHTTSEELYHDEQFHWNVCHCEEKLNVTAHDYNIPGEVLSESTCTENGKQVFYCVCGESVEKELELKEHVFEDEYLSNEEVHWVECVCGEKNNETKHEYNVPGEVTVAPNCTTGGKQMFACVCGVEKELDIPSLGGHVDKNADIICDNEGCTTKVLPAKDTQISLFTANQIGKLISTANQYYVEGVVSQVLDAKNGIFYIQDEAGDEFYFRLPKDANGVLHSSWDQKIVLGDTVKLYGKINKFTTSGSTIPAMQGAVVVELVHEHLYSEATCTEVSSCRCGLTQGELLPHNDANGDDLCDDCGFNVNLKVFETPINTLDNDPNSGVLEGTAKRTWTYDVFTLEVAKGTSTSIYTTKDKYMKLKKNNVVTLTGNGDTLFTEIVITATSSNYAKTLQTSISKIAGVTVEIVDTTNVVVTFNEPTALLSFTLTGTSRFSNIKVIY